MKKAKLSPKFKQTKISAFWLKTPTSERENVNQGKKRKINETSENSTPKRTVVTLGDDSPDFIPDSPQFVKRKSTKRKDLTDLFTSKEKSENLMVANKEADKSGNAIENDSGMGESENTPPSPVLTPVKLAKKVKAEPSPLKNRNSNAFEEKKNEFDFEDFDLDFDDPFMKIELPKEDHWWEGKSEIQFLNPRKCKVLKTTSKTSPQEQIILVEDEETGKKGICKLRDVWAFTEFKVNDLVTVKAVESSDGWIVDGKNGFLALFPEMVVSSTSLVGALFCMRKGILSNFYKGYDPGSKIMVIGNLVHEVLQRCLKISSCNITDINNVIQEIFSSVEHLRELYSCDLTVDGTKLEIMSFVPQIDHFLSVYVKRETAPLSSNFQGSILDIMDIEESVTAPKLGLKGRIDVTTKIKINNREKVMPLELKTGRASFSSEHRNQVILYTMMMSEMGEKVDSGLLLYLRENILKEIIPTPIEIRDMILLRNQLVRFAKVFKEGVLPEPIRLANACSKCAYLSICTSYLNHYGMDKLSENHPMRKLNTSTIKQSHLDYFFLWSKLVLLEEEEDNCKSSSLVDNLVLEKGVVEFRDEFKHTFCCNSKSEPNLPPNTFIFVSSRKDGKICSGKVINSTGSRISVLLNKKLDNFSETYKIEIYKTNLAQIYLTNLGCFIEEKYEQLRDFIVDKQVPTFAAKLDKNALSKNCIKILKSLNEDQQRAVLKFLTANNYQVIRGPPGTGKTHMIVALIKVLLMMNQSVLVTSHTHSSVDNILLRMEDTNYLRLGSLKSIHKNTHAKSFVNLLENCHSLDDIRKLYEHNFVASTCLGIDQNFVQKRKFDVCVVDESSQVLQPEVLKPLFCCKKFILIGDSNQLPPVVKNREARTLGMGESLFERLENESSICLNLQYRMNQEINKLANKLTYNGLLKCANDEIAKATIKIRNKQNSKTLPKWIQIILSNDLQNSVVFVDTSNYFEGVVKEKSNSCSSSTESAIIVLLIQSLLELGITEEEIGVIAPYRAQVELLTSKFTAHNFPEVEVNTVDQYQGRDKGIIFLSCTKENISERSVDAFEILNDKRRLNVAITRAKYKLVILGDRKSITVYKPLENLLKNLNESNVVKLRDGENEFHWKTITE